MLSIGTILQGRYTILGTLGQGGMGAVYLAEDRRLPGRQCAIKGNLPDPNASPQALAQARQQFLAEASVLARLDHPNLPKVSDYFSEAGREYLVMDYVAGEDLASTLQHTGKPLPEKPVLLWTDQVLDALEYLHGQRPLPVIHRDVKPANIRLTPQGKIKLVDFGLVKLLDPSDPRTKTMLRGLGTPEYAPLEQYAAGAGHTDARSDIYSLGATLYHLLTNVAPPEAHQRFLNPNLLVPPRQLNPQLSENTEQVVLRAMEIHPGQRYQTAREMRQALKGTVPTPVPTTPATTPVPISQARPSLLLGALGAVLLFGALGVVLLVVGLVFGSGWARLPGPVTEAPDGASVSPTATRQTMPATQAPTETPAPPSSTSKPPADTPQAPTRTPVPPIPTRIPVPPTPTTEGPVIVFQDNFDRSGLDTSRWQADSAAEFVTVGQGALRMASAGPRYPYVYSRYNLFPTDGNFQLTYRFRYYKVDVCGVGIMAASTLCPAGRSQADEAACQQASEQNGVAAGMWQDSENGLQIWFRSGADRVDKKFPGPDTAWHDITIKYEHSRYEMYLDNRLVYTSLPTPYRPQSIWMGHPADLGSDCPWSSLEVDYVKVYSLPGP
jgi:serine/threonine protein kinase